MSIRYFDAHSHIQFDTYEVDRDYVVAQMAEREIGSLVVGVDLESSKRALTLVQEKPDLYAAVGLHPNSVDREAFDIETFQVLARNSKVRAIGECGLDYFRPADPENAKKKQREVLEQHIQLAVEVDKPLMIHARPSKGTSDTYLDLVDLMGSYKRDYGDRVRGDIHFYVGGVEEAKKLVDLDFTLSFTAVITFTHDYDEVIKALPLTHLLSETDCPYLAPASRRGERNDPLAVRDVVAQMALIRGEDEEIVRGQILKNAERMFALNPL